MTSSLWVRAAAMTDWGTAKVKMVAPLGRWQEPEDIADMVVFPVLGEGAPGHRTTVNVDGGK